MDVETCYYHYSILKIQNIKIEKRKKRKIITSGKTENEGSDNY